MPVNWLDRLSRATIDRLNNGLWNYTPDPDADEVLDLAEAFQRSNRTVERWYNIADQFGRQAPLRSALVAYVGQCVMEMAEGDQRRICQAICLADGGLTRDPITTGKVRVYDHGPYALWQCLEDVSDRINGNLGPVERACWYRIEILEGYIVRVFWRDPKPGQLYTEEECREEGATP